MAAAADARWQTTVGASALDTVSPNILCACECVCEGGYVSETVAEMRRHTERDRKEGLISGRSSIHLRAGRGCQAAAGLRRRSNNQGFREEKKNRRRYGSEEQQRSSLSLRFFF